MKKYLVAFFVFMLSSANYAHAANCSPNPYTLQNGQTADASQVMANFNNLQNCSNNQLLGKNNNLSDVQSSATSRTNLGLGSAATNAASGSTGTVASVFGSPAANDVPEFSDTAGTIGDSGVPIADVSLNTNNLSDLANAGNARTNLGLANGATTSITASTSGPSGTPSDGSLWLQYVP